MKPFWIALCGATTLLTAPTVTAAVVSLGSVRDNTLYLDGTGSLSNGAGQFFFAGNTGTGLLRRGLVAFDLSGIPTGATINSVSLTLHVSMNSTAPSDVSLYAILADWGEGTSDAPAGEGPGTASTPGDATWIHTFYDTSLWSSPGGDFIATPSATLSVSTLGFHTWTSAEMLGDVQQWVNNPSTNFGWMLRGDEATFSTSKRFDTRENPTPEFGPVLVVEYTTTPGDATGDGVVDIDDLLAVIGVWGPCLDCAADLDGDGVVDVDDLLMVIGNWS